MLSSVNPELASCILGTVFLLAFIACLCRTRRNGDPSDPALPLGTFFAGLGASMFISASVM